MNQGGLQRGEVVLKIWNGHLLSWQYNCQQYYKQERLQYVRYWGRRRVDEADNSTEVSDEEWQ